MVCAFITYCHISQKLQSSSIKSQVSGIPFHLRCLDPSVCSLVGNPSVRLLLDDIKKESPKGKDKRLPLTLSLVQKMVQKLRQWCFNHFVDAPLEVIFLSAFYGFLQVGEFTTRNFKFDPACNLTISDISFDLESFTIFLKQSKSDQEHKGVSVVIARTNTLFCPFNSMVCFLKLCLHVLLHEPLFITDKRRAMSRSWYHIHLTLSASE